MNPLQVLGEGSAEIQVTPTVTHVNFSDRKSAETFYFSVKNKRIQGVDGDVELSWVANTAGPLPNSTIKNVNLGGSSTTNGGSGDGVAGGDGVGPGDETAAAVDTDMADVNNNGVDQNGGGGGGGAGGQQEVKEAAGDLDYDVAGDNDWDIA